MKTLILIFVLVASAFAYGWVTLTKRDSRMIDWQYAECFYGSYMSQWNVRIIVSGGAFACPLSIQYNPVSGEWR